MILISSKQQPARCQSKNNTVNDRFHLYGPENPGFYKFGFHVNDAFQCVGERDGTAKNSSVNLMYSMSDFLNFIFQKNASMFEPTPKSLCPLIALIFSDFISLIIKCLTSAFICEICGNQKNKHFRSGLMF